MSSHVKKGYAVSQRQPLYFNITASTPKRKAQAELLFNSVAPNLPTSGSADFVQPLRTDIRVFNFTGLPLTQIFQNGLRAPMDPINLIPYTVPRSASRLRSDVQTLLELMSVDDYKDTVTIVQRFTLHARDDEDMMLIIGNSTLPAELKDQLKGTEYKKSQVGDKTYYAIDGMFMTFISKAELRSYMGALEAHSGVFVSRDDLAQCQPHPYDRNQTLVQGLGFEDDVDKAAVTSYRYVYHDTMPQQVYANIAGLVIAVPLMHDTNEKVGIHIATSVPQKGTLIATVHKLFIDPRDIVEKNGFYVSEKAAQVQLRQEQMDNLLDFRSSMVRAVSDLQKGLDKGLLDAFSKGFVGYGEIMKKESDLLREILDEPLRDLRKEIDAFRTRNEALNVATLMNKAEHEQAMQRRKESQEYMKLIPLGITTVMSLIAVAAKKK